MNIELHVALPLPGVWPSDADTELLRWKKVLGSGRSAGMDGLLHDHGVDGTLAAIGTLNLPARRATPNLSQIFDAKRWPAGSRLELESILPLKTGRSVEYPHDLVDSLVGWVEVSCPAYESHLKLWERASIVQELLEKSMPALAFEITQFESSTILTLPRTDAQAAQQALADTCEVLKQVGCEVVSSTFERVWGAWRPAHGESLR